MLFERVSRTGPSTGRPLPTRTSRYLVRALPPVAPLLRWAGLLSLLCLCAAPRNAVAQTRSEAARAFSEAQAAELRHEHSRASQLYELANRVSPTMQALRSAARTRLAAGDDAIASSHALELQRLYPEDTRTIREAEQLLAETRDRLVRVEATCSAACELSVDGHARGTESRSQHRFFLTPGDHLLLARYPDGRTARAPVSVLAGETISPTLAAPPAERPPALVAAPVVEPAREGLHPAWFITTASSAVVLAGASVWSELERGEYVRNLNPAGAPPMDPTGDPGEDPEARRLELRTNLFMAGAATTGLSAVVLGFLTRWSPRGERHTKRAERKQHAWISPSLQGVRAGVRGHF